MALNLHRIDKDVQRCDRNYWYFTPPNLERLRDIMCRCHWGLGWAGRGEGTLLSATLGPAVPCSPALCPSHDRLPSLCVHPPVILEAFQISALAMLLQEASARPHQHVGGGDGLSISPRGSGEQWLWMVRYSTPVLQGGGKADLWVADWSRGRFPRSPQGEGRTVHRHRDPLLFQLCVGASGRGLRAGHV